MYDSKIPTEIKVGKYYTTSWANKKTLKWKLIDVTRDVAYIKEIHSDRVLKTSVNSLREPNKK